MRGLQQSKSDTPIFSRGKDPWYLGNHGSTRTLGNPTVSFQHHHCVSTLKDLANTTAFMSIFPRQINHVQCETPSYGQGGNEFWLQDPHRGVCALKSTPGFFYGGGLSTLHSIVHCQAYCFSSRDPQACPTTKEGQIQGTFDSKPTKQKCVGVIGTSETPREICDAEYDTCNIDFSHTMWQIGTRGALLKDRAPELDNTVCVCVCVCVCACR